MSVDAAQTMVTQYRELAKVSPATYEPELGLALYDLCMVLHGAPGPITNSYLDLLEEGIALHRRLLRRSPSSLPQLGIMLCWLGFAKHRLGWKTEAREVMEEGVGLIRRMANAQSDLYETQLALALGLASVTLGDVGDHRAAVSAARESVAMWRQLVDEQPWQHDHYLATTLHTLCFALQSAGRGDEASAYAEESVTIARRLRARDPGAANARLLANGLDLQVAALAHRERWQDALPVAEEAVRCYQEARRGGDHPNSLNEAGALNNLSKIMWQLGRQSDAKMYADKAFLECLKRVRDAEGLAELAGLASDIAGMLTSLGMTRRANLLVRFANQRLHPQPPRGLGKLIVWLRGR
ncbi:tetratricopeptide repeat protein [Micromonospora sp. CPCC 205371]|nr:tetratricopeptide repeat protein [Micromonospora sp. CPCC 205371]